MHERLLTKSLFIRALNCPRKLYYAGKSNYADNSLDDDFMQALAEGGIQVGALARCYFPDGILVGESDKTTALAHTTELLKQERVTLFEAAVKNGTCFFRADILVKDGNRLDLIEVKAKSYDQDTAEGFLKKKDREVDAEWRPYVYDVAFQKLVLQRAFPKATIRAYLMLADKRAAASVNGLNQRFVLQKQGNRTTVIPQGDCSLDGLGDEILVKVSVDDVLRQLAIGKREETASRMFSDYVDLLADNFRKDIKIDWPVGTQCQGCEFKASPDQRQRGLQSGFCECWHEQWGLTEDQLAQPNVFDIWNYRKKAELLAQRKFFLSALSKTDFLGDKPEPKKVGVGLSPDERRWMQVDKATRSDRKAFFDAAGLATEMADWRFPLHFIDFETSTVAIPFNRGRRPYEGIAFQFSHHIVCEDGRIEHAGQFLNVKRGIFPSYDFVRALKRELDKDDGTIFRYASHENTYLNLIRSQMLEEASEVVPDRDELCSWIKTITKSTSKAVEQWEGSRNMVDMWELVKRYYYDPYTRGSNSIKWVLPAVLNSSPYLQEKYSYPIYGAKDGIPSLNYCDQVWIKRDACGAVRDPYHLLPSVTPPEVSAEQLEHAEGSNGRLADGAAAMMAYARLQFTSLPDDERQNLKSALLRYCELDTMAMVLIWEHWMNLLGKI